MSDRAVRMANQSDAAEIAELGARTFSATYAEFNKPDDMAAYIADFFSLKTILEELGDPKSAFLLVQRSGASIGFAKVRNSEVPLCINGPDPIELERIYVDTDQQGNGIGAMLMQAVIEYTRAEACSTIWLGVWGKDLAARGFYERLGFTSVGHKTFTVGSDVQNDIVMSLRLDRT